MPIFNRHTHTLEYITASFLLNVGFSRVVVPEPEVQYI